MYKRIGTISDTYCIMNSLRAWYKCLVGWMQLAGLKLPTPVLDFWFFNSSSCNFSNNLSTSCNSSSYSFWSKSCNCSPRHVLHTFFILKQFYIFLISAQMVLNKRNFGVEQIFQADEFLADDYSPFWWSDHFNWHFQWPKGIFY